MGSGQPDACFGLCKLRLTGMPIMPIFITLRLATMLSGFAGSLNIIRASS